MLTDEIAVQYLSSKFKEQKRFKKKKEIKFHGIEDKQQVELNGRIVFFFFLALLVLRIYWHQAYLRGHRRVVAVSAGNAGLAAAHAATTLGMPVTVVVPSTTLNLLVSRLKREGADVMVRDLHPSRSTSLFFIYSFSRFFFFCAARR
jgi:NADPH-dependent 2,4-dienoyl-CoA reductase/sulfur reductase-like enzyme